MMEATLTIKLPDVLRRQARSVADQRGQTISEIVRDALQQYLTQAQAERQTLADMYAEFAEEDRQLARAGLAHYAHVLAQEEKTDMNRGDVYLADLDLGRQARYQAVLRELETRWGCTLDELQARYLTQGREDFAADDDYVQWQWYADAAQAVEAQLTMVR